MKIVLLLTYEWGGSVEGGVGRVAGGLGFTQRRDKNFHQGQKPSASRGFMSELKLRTPNAGGDALKRAPTTFADQAEPMISMERLKFEVPDRAGLATIGKYAHLVVPGGGDRVRGATEASRACQ